jgi:hypothetical protein
LNNIWAMIQKEYWCLIWNINMQSASSIWSNLLSNATVNIIEIVRNCVRCGEANVFGSSYYWNFRTSSFKQVACLILKNEVLLTVGCPIFPFYIDSQISVHRKFKKKDQLIFRNAKEIYFNEKFPIL